ncbi:gliding motility-associated C-terminal domain-containing protein [Pedobacter nototheniae]|uniref:gliding motility-associated C-terminal domain-containing protein n=1 Tax=Pedobacter nototheniae TaxID=2488994 RepID=UPI00292D1299|nr:gliding motility-associated C-terminal domain-containing protein [Pedobacter nototheniae]
MINKFSLVLIVLLVCFFKLTAQTFYVSSIINPNYAPGGSCIYKVEITDEGVKSTKITDCAPGDQYFSIAMNRDNLFWLGSSGIYAADVKESSIENCRRLFPSMAYSNSLTLGSDNKLYYCSTFLFATDINNGKTDILGPLNYFPMGDMCFYKKELYMAAAQGIVKVNIKEPNKSTLHIPLTDNKLVYGIVSVSKGLRKNTVYGLENVNNSQTNIIEFDIENQKVVGVVGTLPYTVLDAASMVEDGSIIGIELDKVDITQDCLTGNTANVDILTAPHIEDFTYTLNGVTNTTGKFVSLPKGQYTLSISSASDAYTTTVDVPEFNLIKPDYSWQIKNQLCETLGEITFKTPEQSSTYQIKYEGKLFPLNNTFSNLISGKTYHFEIINKNGCKVDDLDLVVGKDKCKIQFDKAEVVQQCDVYHKGVITVLTKPHTAAYTYTLNNNITNATGIFKNLTPGTYNIKIISDEDEFETTAIVPNYKQLQPQITFTKVNPVCVLKGSIKFDPVLGSESYKIKFKNDILPYDHLFNNLEIGNYHFVVINKDGCLIDEYDTELVYEPCPIVINGIEILAECNVLNKGIIKINCPPIPETYTFILNNTVINSSGVFNTLSPGSYNIEVKASGGAPSTYRTVIVPDYSLTKPFTIVNAKNPVCDLTGEISFSIGNRSADYNIRYNGVVYPGNYVFSSLYEGNYTFSILKLNGCIVDELNVILETEACNDVEFPSAFSPNWDNVNDSFKAKEGSRAFNFQLQIFDRRGVIIFSANKLYDAWNGDYKGQPVPVGTYFWIASFTTQENKRITKKGSVTLIR